MTMSVAMVFLESPQGDEVKEVQATAAILTPYMAAGWHQVPAPSAVPNSAASTGQKPATPAGEKQQHGEY
jgi:hypothetical protein